MASGESDGVGARRAVGAFGKGPLGPSGAWEMRGRPRVKAFGPSLPELTHLPLTSHPQRLAFTLANIARPCHRLSQRSRWLH